MPRSARTTASRQALAFGAVFMIAVSVTLGAIYSVVANALDRATDRQLRGELQSLVRLHASEGIDGLRQELGLRLSRISTGSSVYLLTAPDGAAIAGNLIVWPSNVRDARSGVTFDVDGTPVQARTTSLADGTRLLVGRDVSERRNIGSLIAGTTVVAVLVITALSLGMGYAFSRRVSARVEAAAAACTSIVSGDLAHRLPVSKADDELDALARAVNGVLDELEELTRTRQTIFNSAAHDLRGPLYRLRNRIEAMARRNIRGQPLTGFDEALRDIDGLQRTLVMLLQIARAQSGSPLMDSVRFDLAALVRDMVELFEPPARAESLGLVQRAMGTVPINGNRQLVAQLISNLIENAIKYVPAGGTITATAARVGNGARLTVADNGPGIPAADRARAIAPFVRLEAANDATGSGLGLSLVAAIARLHGAELRLEDNEPGLRVVIDFPAEASSSVGQPAGAGPQSLRAS